MVLEESFRRIVMETCWNDLPEDIVVNIFRRLPVPKVCQMRCVCKKWHSLPRTPLYINLSSRATLEKPYLSFLVIERGQLVLSTYSPSLSKWFKRPLTFLRNFFIFPTRECSFVAGDGGLFCVASTVNGGCFFVVVNPISKKWRKLPPIPQQRPSFYFRGMHVDRKSRTYKLLVRGRIEGSDIWKTNVYDSRTHSWKVGSDMPPNFCHPWSVNCTFCNGRFYCLDNRSRTLRAYDVQEGVWSEVDKWKSSLSGNFFYVKGYAGLMKWRQTLDWPSGRKNFEILRLDLNKYEWVKVEMAPISDSLQPLFHVTRFDRCEGEPGVLTYFSNLEDCCMLVYNFAEKAWSLVVVCSKTVSKTCFEGVFALNPGFDFPV